MAKAKLMIKASQWEPVAVEIEGLPPGLLMHRRPREPYKLPKDPQDEHFVEEARQGLYVLDPSRDDVEYGFPAIGFRQAIMTWTKTLSSNDSKNAIRQGLRMDFTPDGLIPIVPNGAVTASGVMGGDIITVKDEPWVVDLRQAKVMRSGIWRARPLFAGGWTAVIPMQYNEEHLRHEDVIACLHEAGGGVGVGDYRQQSGGPFGGFRVVGL